MSRWRTLFAVVVGLALVIAVAGRLPSGAAREAAPAPAPVEATLAFRVTDGAVEPAFATVPRGQRVRLVVENASTREITPRLPGYDDRIAFVAIAPGATWSGSFLADRPGADFALWIDDEPGARIAIAGSHLVEGHR